jgi:hypothetical protein
MRLLVTLKAISPFRSISLVFRICEENFLMWFMRRYLLHLSHQPEPVHEHNKRDQFLMILHPKFGATRSNLMNRDPSPSLDVCFGEFLREEQRLLTQATFQQDSNPNLVANAAYERGNGKDMRKSNVSAARKMVILPPTVQRKFAITVRNKVTLSKNVPLDLQIVKLQPIRLQ